MLFLSSFDSYPLDEHVIGRDSQFAIRRDINQPNSGLVFDVFQMPMNLTDREMAILLRVFGNLLPTRPPDLTSWRVRPVKKYQHDRLSFLRRSMLITCQPYCEFGFTESTCSHCTLIMTKPRGLFHSFVFHSSALRLCDREGRYTHSQVRKGTLQTLEQAMTSLQIF